MSLSFLTRQIVFLAALTLVAVGGWQFGPTLASYLAEAQSSTTLDADIDDRSIVYRMRSDRPLEFASSQPIDVVRGLVQASVARDQRARVEGFVYSIEVTLFGIDGALLDQHVVALHSDAPDFVFATGETWRFFRDRPELAAGMDEIVVEASAPIGRSQWRLVDADPAVRAVDIRVYERRPLLASQALTNFHRRSAEEQEMLALGNAFPPDMMTGEEMAYAAINMWRPLGPAGIAGRDYEALVLYEGTRRGRTRVRE